ncbi:MAG: transcriptional repressor [Bacteroidales bacterium]|jgi:Fe2+ or Zn2+ uptake regulation protein|nr:transcriptional repressor [Bacteroidales bacterium]
MNRKTRKTKTKEMVMNTLSESNSALCHEDIDKKLSGKVDRVTIYRILQGFCNEGKVHKIQGDNGKTYYALCDCCSAGNHQDNHVHFRCIGCETVSCINETVAKPELPKGYSISGFSLLIFGYCPNCLTY